MSHTSLQMRKRAAQQGSTLLGIIIGLVVGLAIAVVVALVITKGSSPFTNKLGKSDKPNESASAPLADPNKPLYGNRDAAKEASKEFARDDAPAATPAPAPAASPTPVATPTTAATDPNKAKPSPTPNPTAPAATAAPATAAVSPTPSNPEDKWIYYLQAGAFRDQADAEKTRANLALLGFEAAVSERNNDNGVLYRVRIGPFNQVDTMNRARAKLSENGIDVSVVRNQK